MILVEAHGLRKRFANGEVITFPDIRIKAGEIVWFTGASGKGKTTLLSILSGSANMLVHDDTHLNLILNGQNYDLLAEDFDVSKLKGRIGWVFQNPDMIGDFSRADNLDLPAGVSRATLTEDERRYFGRELNLGGWTKDAKTSSGGERQRLALVRAINAVKEGGLLLLDEPIANLDDDNHAPAMQLLEHWVQARPDRAAIIISHQQPRFEKMVPRNVKIESQTVSPPDIEAAEIALFRGPKYNSRLFWLFVVSQSLLIAMVACIVTTFVAPHHVFSSPDLSAVQFTSENVSHKFPKSMRHIGGFFVSRDVGTCGENHALGAPKASVRSDMTKRFTEDKGCVPTNEKAHPDHLPPFFLKRAIQSTLHVALPNPPNASDMTHDICKDAHMTRVNLPAIFVDPLREDWAGQLKRGEDWSQPWRYDASNTKDFVIGAHRLLNKLIAFDQRSAEIKPKNIRFLCVQQSKASKDRYKPFVYVGEIDLPTFTKDARMAAFPCQAAKGNDMDCDTAPDFGIAYKPSEARKLSAAFDDLFEHPKTFGDVIDFKKGVSISLEYRKVMKLHAIFTLMKWGAIALACALVACWMFFLISLIKIIILRNERALLVMRAHGWPKKEYRRFIWRYLSREVMGSVGCVVVGVVCIAGVVFLIAIGFETFSPKADNIYLRWTYAVFDWLSNTSTFGPIVDMPEADEGGLRLGPHSIFWLTIALFLVASMFLTTAIVFFSILVVGRNSWKRHKYAIDELQKL